MKKLLGIALVATGVLGAAEADASYYYRHGPKCKILTVEVTAESKIIIEGQGLTKRNQVPTVSFGGNEVPLDAHSETRIEGDLSAVELGESPKDFLLEVKRSRWDFYGCRSHMITFVPPPVEDNSKIVFITSADMTGKIEGLAGADEICMAHAAAAELEGTFVAYLSDSGTNAIDRLPEDGGPWVNTRGQPVALDRAALTTDSGNGFLENAIQFDEAGRDPEFLSVWTGTNPEGMFSGDDCDAWRSDNLDLRGEAGVGDSVDGTWVQTEAPPCNLPARLYCFQS